MRAWRGLLIIHLAAVLGVPAPARAQPAPRPSPSPVPDAGAKPVSQQELEDLRRQIAQEDRSSLELRFDGHAESGDVNHRLDFLRYGARFNLRRNEATSLSFGVRRTPYKTREGVLDAAATGVTLGGRRRSSARREWQGELSGTRFPDIWSITGFGSLTIRPSEALRYSISVRRTNVEESMLAVAGLRPSFGPFAGHRVGAVHDNRVVVGASYRLPASFDVYGEGAVGSRSGANVDDNFFKQLGAGVGYNALARAEDSQLSLLRLGLSFDYFGFAEDRLGYGGASLVDIRGLPVSLERLGTDGISPEPAPGHPGVGGYFSPRRFVSGVARLEGRGRLAPSVDYQASVFVGRQSFTGVAGRRAAGVSAALTVRSGQRFSVPVTYTWDDFGPFVQQTLVARMVVL